MATGGAEGSCYIPSFYSAKQEELVWSLYQCPTRPPVGKLCFTPFCAILSW
jgi:hypothetical protein